MWQDGIQPSDPNCCIYYTKIVEYCNRVVTQPPSIDNDVDLKAFILELVNTDEQTLFGLLVTVDYLAIKRILSLAYEEFLLFNIMPKFSSEEEKWMRSANPWAFN
ncbi:hypothetical protein M9H77_31409 [Catharanthus roseus]|uniref:Uncharacterized protein n=1 Tax=Catharanthus roseus TaxID=4058 RepID=A0ACC0A011_CATRO|nr:hypothetical protein M9H77_31409 [Catharanthus roseus]